jgi:hypothetical protein
MDVWIMNQYDVIEHHDVNVASKRVEKVGTFRQSAS